MNIKAQGTSIPLCGKSTEWHCPSVTWGKIVLRKYNTKRILLKGCAQQLCYLHEQLIQHKDNTHLCKYVANPLTAESKENLSSVSSSAMISLCVASTCKSTYVAACSTNVIHKYNFYNIGK